MVESAMITNVQGTRFWYLTEKCLHCEDGPAIIYFHGEIEWILNNIIYSFDDWCDELKLSKEKRIGLKLKYC